MKKNKRTKRRKSRISKRTRAVTRAARKLLAAPAFFHRVGTKVGELGIIGEKTTCEILFAAGLTATLPKPAEPVSVIIKGSSSSGKSKVLRTVVQLFPPECVTELASLSKKALVYGQGELDGQVLLLMEYHGGRDAQYFMRLLQSEGGIAHEATSVRGHRRSTTVTERIGRPVVLTTTTESEVYRDDETRALTIRADESQAQTQAILKALVRGPNVADGIPTAVFQEAVRLVRARRPKFDTPKWFENVAERVPSSDVRVRRDWGRFLSFCKAIAICRSFREDCNE